MILRWFNYRYVLFTFERGEKESVEGREGRREGRKKGGKEAGREGGRGGRREGGYL